MRSKRVLFGLAVSGLFIGFFLYRVDLREMGHALAGADYRFIVPGVLLYLLSMTLRTLRWRTVLTPLGRFPLVRVWPVVIVGYAANNLLPVRLGELVRAYFLGHREGVSKTSVLATILVERAFDGLVLLFLAALVSLFLPVAGLVRELGEQIHVNWLVLTLGLTVPFVAAIGAFITLAARPEAARLLVSRLLSLLPRGVQGRARQLTGRFLDGFSTLRTPRGVATVFLLSLPVWLAEALVYWVLALGFGMDAVYGHMLTLAGVLVLTLATSNLGTAVPSSAGGVGPFEFFAQATLIFFGVASATASAYALVLHATLLAPVTLLGLVYLWAGDQSLVGLVRASQGPEAPASPETAPRLDEEGLG